METATNFIDKLIEKLERYFSITVKISKLKSIENSAMLATLVLSKLSVFLMLLIFVLFCSFGLSFYLGELLGKLYYGFVIVSMIFLILAILFHFYLHKILLKPVCKIFIDKLS